MTSGRAIADQVYEVPLPAEEFERRLRDAMAELAGPEGQAMREQLEWFARRYPTPLERLRYSRRKYAEAERMRGAAHVHEGPPGDPAPGDQTVPDSPPAATPEAIR